jgi:hypothetical protein
MNRKGLAAAGLALLFVITAGCSFLQRGEQSSPLKLVEAYMEAFRIGDFEQMVILSGGWDGPQDELDFTRRLVEMIELKSYTIEQVDIVSSSEAFVEVTVTLVLLGYERTQTSRVRVQKEEGKWYLDEGILN